MIRVWRLIAHRGMDLIGGMLGVLLSLWVAAGAAHAASAAGGTNVNSTSDANGVTKPARAANPANQAAPRLLWITTDITPPARTALITRLAAERGMSVSHLEYPLRGAPALTADERARLLTLWASAAAVWLDAPHMTAQSRLQALLKAVPGALGAESAQPEAHPDVAAALLSATPRRPLVWVPPEPSRLNADMAVPEGATARMAAYLQAGGERNLRHAFSLLAAALNGEPVPALPPPRPWPARGLYHPDAPDLMDGATAMAAWLNGQPPLRGRPLVAVLVHRYHFVNGSTAWLDQWLRMFQQQGMAAVAVFGQQVDAAGLAALLEGRDVQGRALPPPALVVSHQLLPQSAALQPLFTRWKSPVLVTQPYRAGGVAAWEQDDTGLSTADVPFYLAQPEGAGGIDPMMVVAHEQQGARPVLIERNARAVVDKAGRLLRLQGLPPQDKRLVAMVYNYPPGASNFGASFLNVPRSLARVSQALAEAGYDTHRVGEDDWVRSLQPLMRAYYPDADLPALLAQGQAAPLPLADYQAWWSTLPRPVRARIEAQWGPPERSRYVVTWQGRRVFVVPRLQVGKLAVLPQPPREETLHLGQNPFMHRSRTPLSHHYLAVYLWARTQADALIHFGTHGTQEWAPGKARALDVLDDALLPLGDVPVVYPYIVDNLGEALTAKRRGRAVLVSHRTPVFSPAGFEARMAHMHELMHEWETVDAGPTKVALERELTAQFVEHQLHRDLGWTAERIAADFAGFLERLHPYLDNLAQSSQPRGLAVFGQVPEPAQRRQLILQALRKPLIEALGEDIDEAFLIDHQAVATSRPAQWLDAALADPEAASRLDLRPQAPQGFVPNRAARKPIDTPALLALGHRAQALERLLVTEGEIPGLLTALSGHFVEAAYGGDPIRNPDSLPTGRNLTGLDPSRLPTRQAYEVAQALFDDWLRQWRSAHGGAVPARLALSMWAGETLRHQGIMEAQAMVALGVRPVWDDAGRPHRLALIPAGELKRPRVDVLLSITGSYRDQFPALMALLDQAVALAAGAEPDNAVARHTREVEADLRGRGVPAAQAAVLGRARIFGNAVGDYGTGLSEAVQSDGLRRDDARLGELFLQRMSQPYVDGEPLQAGGLGSEGAAGGAGGAAAFAQALGAHLRRTDAALMSRSSHLYAMVTSDDPFQYLGGLSAAAKAAGRAEGPELYVSQLQDTTEAATVAAAQAVALEMQSRYLHPGWLQAQKAEGYAGTLQVLKALQFTWGWQAVAPGTVRSDHWQSMYEVFVKDRHQLGVPEWLRSQPQVYAQALERLVQAARMGHWQADEGTRRELATLYRVLTSQAPLPGALQSVQGWVARALNDADVPVPHADTPPAAARPRLRTPRPIMPQPRAQAPAEARPIAPARPSLLLRRQIDVPGPSALSQHLAHALVWVMLLLWASAGAVWQARRRPATP